MENTSPSQDMNIRANQQKDQQDRKNELQAQTNPQYQSGRDQDDDQIPQQGANGVRRVNEAQRDQQIVQNQRNQHRT